MATDPQLPQGQLNTAAKPVDAFIQPVNYQVAQPGQPAQLPGVSGMQLVNQGGGLNVAGENSFQRLAEDLAPFNKQLTEAMQTAGLQFASWQMQKGEAEFMEAYRKAQLAVDQQGEVGEGQYAKASRDLYSKDKDAGWGMWLGNPYREMGAARARSRLAGQEIQYRMAGIESQISTADYEKPDQGFAKLQSLRAGLISQVTQSWGVDEGSPGFQKYAAPAIEKAAERSANNLIEDRRKYFDEMKPKQLAQLLTNEVFVEARTKKFEYKGKVYEQGVDPASLYWQAFGLRLNDMARDFLSKAGPGGMASKWAREAYGILQADAQFTDDQLMLNRIGQIQSSEPLRGADGKPVKGPTGEDLYLTWDQLYRQENIDSQIKYEQAGYSLRNARAQDISKRAVAEMDLAAGTTLPGPQRDAAGVQALAAFTAAEEQRLGRKLTAVEIYEIKKNWNEANKLNVDLVATRVAPDVEISYLGELEQKFGTQFNAAAERARVNQIAAQMAVSDPQRAQQFQANAFRQIEQKEKEVQDFSGYTSARDKTINDNIQARLRRNYEYLQGAVDPKADREESERRQRLAYTSHVNARIREAEAARGRKLTESEVRSVTQTAIDEYGKKDKDELQYLFPGSRAYPNTPSVDPYRTIQSVPLGPDGKPKPPESAKGPDGKPLQLYNINQLDDIPNRRVVLRQYATQPVLSLNAIRDVVFAGIGGKALPVKFERAWRDAGARNGYDFLIKQLEFYPNYSPEWDDQDLIKLKQRLQAYAGSQNGAIAYGQLQQVMPALAGLQGWAYS